MKNPLNRLLTVVLATLMGGQLLIAGNEMAASASTVAATETVAAQTASTAPATASTGTPTGEEKKITILYTANMKACMTPCG